MLSLLRITCSFLSLNLISRATEEVHKEESVQNKTQKDSINQKILDYTNQYGAKYANLRVLKENLQTMNADVQVPEFAGISNEKMINFITQTLRYENLKTDWQALQAEKNEQGILEKAGEISKKLEEAFKKNDGNDLKNLFGEDEWKSIEQFKKSHTFMVRSTGKEDSKEFSNAGGNESVANVKFETQALLEAIKTVVCSYVSDKSLKQRMDAARNAGKKFEVGDLFLPVLVQKMIGEKTDNQDIKKIPSSGVLFTTDPQGYVRATA
jgi:hypothetical protein